MTRSERGGVLSIARPREERWALLRCPFCAVRLQAAVRRRYYSCPQCTYELSWTYVQSWAQTHQALLTELSVERADQLGVEPNLLVVLEKSRYEVEMPGDRPSPGRTRHIERDP